MLKRIKERVTLRAVAVYGLVQTAILATTTGVAMAASAKDIGTHIGSTMNAWGTALFTGVLSLVVIPPLLKRNHAEGAAIAFLAVLLGGFVFYKAGVAHMITGLWKTAETGN